MIMAEKKHGLGTALLIGTAAAAVAGGLLSYIKRAEIKRLAEDIIIRVKPTNDGGVYADTDDGEQPAAGKDGANAGGCADAAADASELNIIDSGISLESVDRPAAEPEPAEEPADGAGAEAPADGDEAKTEKSQIPE